MCRRVPKPVNALLQAAIGPPIAGDVIETQEKIATGEATSFKDKLKAGAEGGDKKEQ